MTDSGVPGFTEDQLQEYLSSGSIQPIYKTTAGIDSSVEIYEINGRLILQWATAEWTDTGYEVLDTTSLDKARSVGDRRVFLLAEISNTNFDKFLGLGSLAGTSSPDRFYPLPEGFRPIRSYVLTSDYYQDDVAEIVLHSFDPEFRESSHSAPNDRVLAFSKAQGLVVGEFQSLDDVGLAVIDEPPGFTLKMFETGDS